MAFSIEARTLRDAGRIHINASIGTMRHDSVGRRGILQSLRSVLPSRARRSALLREIKASCPSRGFLCGDRIGESVLFGLC